MNNLTRRAALRAAARVALSTFSLHALACSAGSGDDIFRDYPDERQHGARSKKDAGGQPCTGPELACLPEVTLPPPDSSTPPQIASAALECCAPHIRDLDASAVNCCKAFIADSVGKSFSVQVHADELGVRQPCCFGGLVAPSEELYAYPLCTPWGPPMPPEMPASTLAVV